MKLQANECAACRRPVGYIAPGALAIPTFCILCAGDKETMREWGHKIDQREKPLAMVLRDYRANLNRMDIPEPKAAK